MTPEQLKRINQQLREQRERKLQRHALTESTSQQYREQQKQLLQQIELRFQQEQQQLMDRAQEMALKRRKDRQLASELASEGMVREAPLEPPEIKNCDDMPMPLYDYSF